MVFLYFYKTNSFMLILHNIAICCSRSVVEKSVLLCQILTLKQCSVTKIEGKEDTKSRAILLYATEKTCNLLYAIIISMTCGFPHDHWQWHIRDLEFNQCHVRNYSLNQCWNASFEEVFIDSKETNGLIVLPSFPLSSSSMDQYVWLSLNILYGLASHVWTFFS